MAKQRSTQSTPSSQRRGFDGIFLQINPGHENTKPIFGSSSRLRDFVVASKPDEAVKKPLTAEAAEIAEKKAQKIRGVLGVLGGKTAHFFTL